MPFLRLIPAIVLFLVSLLAVLPAPTHFFWMVAIGVTELGHVLALVCLAMAVPLWNNSWSGRLAAGLCVAAAVLALTPVIRAAGAAPLSVVRLFLGASAPDVKPQVLSYPTGDGTKLSLDFYPSQHSTRSPLIVVIHGGSWNSGDNKDFISMDQFLAARGFAVADLLYRLAPRSPFPAASEDTLAAIRFLREQSKELNINPEQIVLLGRSAGGQIALHVAYTANDPGIRGVISFYGPTDLFWSWEHPGNPLVIDTRAVLTDYLGGDPARFGDRYAAASPIRLASKTSPPTLLFHGGRDELVNSYHSSALSRRLTELGVSNRNVSLPWATHGFDYILRGPGGQISTSALESFLQNVFNIS